MTRNALLVITSALLLVFGSVLTTVRARSQAAPPPKTTVIEGRRERDEASVSTRAMKYLPFDVPEGVTRLTIHKEFNHGTDPKEKNTVDMGLFDPRGYGPGGPGFRGWQGGSPEDLTVTGDWRTSSPHAVPGPIPAGRWYIAQYYLKSTPDGLGYKYTVTLDFGGTPPPVKTPEPPPYNPGVVKPGPGWFAGNLHAHTIHSDGARTLEELVSRNEAAGFDFLASTEHNSPTAHYDFADVGRRHPNHLLLYGDELTTPSGHADIIGQKPGYFFDFRRDAHDGKLPQTIAEAHKQGALFIINHPFANCTSCYWHFEPREWEDADAIEVWNGNWTPDDREAVNLWNDLLKEGRHVTATGGSDYHRGDDPLAPFTWVYAGNLSRDKVLEGIRKGRVLLNEGAGGPKLSWLVKEKETPPGERLKLRAVKTTALPGSVSSVVYLAEFQVRVVGGQGNSLHLIWSEGDIARPVPSGDVTLDFKLPVSTYRIQNVGSDYLRVELTDNTGRMRALLNPLYVSPR